ncbi:hypothetical protein ACFLWY_02475 [Chloroflexota bacterium]
MAVEISGIVALSVELDKAAAALGTSDEAMAPVQGAGSVTKFTAVQEGAIRGIDIEIESKQSDGDDVIGSVYVGGSRVDGTEVTIAGAGTSAGADHVTARLDKDIAPVSEGDDIVVKVKSTDAVNCTPAGILATVYLQLGKSEI